MLRDPGGENMGLKFHACTFSQKSSRQLDNHMTQGGGINMSEQAGSLLSHRPRKTQLVDSFLWSKIFEVL